MQDVVSTDPEAPDLGHYMRPLRRHARFIALCTLLGLVLGGAAAALSRSTYSAAARVQVYADVTDQPVNAANGRTSGAINLDTEAQVVKSSPVATIAQQLLKTPTPAGALIGHVTISVPPNTTVLRIEYQAHSAGAAKAGAAAFAQAYLTNRTNVARTYIANGVKSLGTQIDALKTSLTQIADRLATLPNHSPAKIAALSQQATLTAQLNSLSNSQNQLSTTVVNPGSIISNAALISSGKTTRAIMLLAGLVLGLLAGVVAAFMRDRYDSTVRSVDDLYRLGVPVIAEIPEARRHRVRRRAGSAARQQAARLRADQTVATLVATALGDEGGTIYVTGVSPEQTAHNTAQRLAAELGRFGSTVSLVRPDGIEPPQPVGPAITVQPPPPATRPPTAPPPAPGAGHVGWPEATPSNGAAPPPPVSPAVLPPRDEPQVEPQATVSPGTLATIRLVEGALRQSRFVVIEGEQASIDPQAYVLASLSGVTVLVVEPGVTSRSDVREAAEQIRVTSSELLGALIWRPAPSDKPPPDDRSQDRRPRRRAKPAEGPAGSGGRSETPATAPRIKPAGPRPAVPGTGPETGSRTIDVAR